MKKGTIGTILITIMILGVVMYSINYMFGSGTIRFVEQYTTESGISLYRINLHDYLKNIEMTLNQTEDLRITLPIQAFSMDASLEAIVNNIKILGNQLILVLNILLYPLRIGGYTVKQILAVIGMDFTTTGYNGLSWLRDLVNGLNRFEIPYM